jgi:hypothetical protein
MDSTHSAPPSYREASPGRPSGVGPGPFLAEAGRTLAGGLLIGCLGLLLFAAATRSGQPVLRAPSPVELPVSAPEGPAPLPRWLSATGLYDIPTRGNGAPSQAPLGDGKLHPDVLAYSPVYPLWTDGATKRRYLRLRPGTFIDGADPDRWQFPVGTQLWKEFSFGRRVETRYAERAGDGSWRLATYVWNEGGTDAELAPNGARDVAELPGSSLRHDVPSEQDCAACHGGRSSPVLGLGALQLSTERDPRAPHAELPAEGSVDARSLLARGLLRGFAPSLVNSRILAPSPEARAAAGYLYGNCSHCHNQEGPLRELGLSFDQSVQAAGSYERMASTVVGQASRFRVPGEAEPLRVVPGQAQRSALHLRVSSRFPAWQMPPLGTELPDEAAVELLARWIESLKPSALPSKKDPT